MTPTLENITDEKWKQVEDFFYKRFEKVPDLQAMLYLIGINEYGQLPHMRFSKEQKQDLMHVAVCTLLIPYEYYILEGYDHQGWPHFLPLRPLEADDLDQQEELLKNAIYNYIQNQ